MYPQIKRKSVESITLTIITLFIMLAVFYLITKDVAADTVEENFEYSGIRELEVDASFFNVQVSGYNGDAVEGRIIMPQIFKERNYIEVLHSKKGSILEIQVKRIKGSIPPSTDDKIIKIHLPKEIKVDLMTSSGDIEIEDIETYDIRLKSSSGDIDINNCSGFLTIKSSSGDQSVNEYTGDISSDTSSGKQFYKGITGNIEADSSSGDITIDGQTGTLDLKASSGDLKGQDVFLEGDSSFSTSSGKISFDFKNDFDEFSFDLSSSSGKISVGQSRAKGKLVIGSGKIQITGESTSGSQSYR